MAVLVTRRGQVPCSVPYAYFGTGRSAENSLFFTRSPSAAPGYAAQHLVCSTLSSRIKTHWVFPDFSSPKMIPEPRHGDSLRAPTAMSQTKSLQAAQGVGKPHQGGFLDLKSLRVPTGGAIPWGFRAPRRPHSPRSWGRDKPLERAARTGLCARGCALGVSHAAN